MVTACPNLPGTVLGAEAKAVNKGRYPSPMKPIPEIYQRAEMGREEASGMLSRQEGNPERWYFS